MAKRRDIREAFYGELETSIASLTTIDATDISQDSPESDEELPRIVHSDDYRKVPMNDASKGPHEIEYDDGGTVASIVAYSMMQAQFGVSVVHHNEQEKEDIYEAVRRHFEKFEHPFWDVESIHSDIHDIEVDDSTSDDDPDREPVARGDNIIIRLGYKRDFRVVRDDLSDQYSDYDDTFTGTVEDVVHEIDADSDGTTDETYNTT